MNDLRFKVVLIIQLCAAAGLLTFIAFSPGEWNAQRWAGLMIAIPATILLFTARLQLGRSFTVRPQARELVTQGIYSKIRNPIYVFSAFLVLAIALTLQKLAILAVLLVLIPAQVI